MKHHKLGGLKQDMYSLTVLEAKSLRSECGHGWFFLEPLEESLLHGPS